MSCEPLSLFHHSVVQQSYYCLDLDSLHRYIVTLLQCKEMCPSGNLLSFYALYDFNCLSDVL